jgi:hypothetical protein
VRDSVRTAFCRFTDRFEDNLRYPYTDRLGLVTTGRGNLIDAGPRRLTAADPIGNADPAPALALPWMHPDGTLAPAVEVRTAWWAVKRAWPTVQSTACEKLTTIRLSPAAVDALTFTTLDRMWAKLHSRFADLENWPADAQLGVLSMSWAMGEMFHFPHFEAAVAAQRFDIAAGPPGDATIDPSKRGEAWMNNNGLPGPNPANPGLHPRNLANKVLFANAARVVAGLSPELLYYPTALV